MNNELFLHVSGVNMRFAVIQMGKNDALPVNFVKRYALPKLSQLMQDLDLQMAAVEQHDMILIWQSVSIVAFAKKLAQLMQ